MNKNGFPRKSYETPMTKILPLAGCHVLAGSGDKEDEDDKELPFDPGDGTYEALSKRHSTVWDDESEDE